MDPDELRERSRVVWDTGDYGPTSDQLEPAAEALVAALEVGPDHDVLDVAAGHGNCALAAARRGATVTATDFAPGMVTAGRRRTRREGLSVAWQQADAVGLPFPDASFDRVTSVFGAIFAAEQEAAAAEAVRVLRPGGVAGLTAWRPDGYADRLMEIRGRYLSAPSGAQGWLDWGRREHVTGLFAATGCSLEIRDRTLAFHYPSWEQWSAGIQAHGFSVVARQQLAEADYRGLLADLRAMTEQLAGGTGEPITFEAGYVEILATRP